MLKSKICFKTPQNKTICLTFHPLYFLRTIFLIDISILSPVNKLKIDQNNPKKIVGLEGYGLEIIEIIEAAQISLKNGGGVEPVQYHNKLRVPN